jgi:enterochelin esterase-like enzyme
VRIDLKPPKWATHCLSDLDDWNKAPLPVDAMVPFHIPDDSYFEYAYTTEAGEKRPDPANENPRLNPWWEFASNITGPAYRPCQELPAGDVRPLGRVLRMTVDSVLLKEERRILVYSPPGLADAPLPHILFQDGKAYFGWGKVPQVLDSLMSRSDVPAAHLVFVPPRSRTEEYAFNPLYQRFLTEELLPAVEKRIKCNGQRVAWGASLGGLLSAELAWQYPHLFQRVVSQSGAFLFSPDMDFKNPFAGGESFRNKVLAGPDRATQWYLECGTLEWLLGSNERLVDTLQRQGMEAALVRRNAGHNWINWRNGLAAGLRFALKENPSE